MVKLTKKQIWQHRLEALREAKKRILTQITPKQAMKAALILFVLCGVFAVSVSHLMSAGRKAPQPATANQSPHENVPPSRGFFAGNEVRREVESYSSSEACFVPAYGPVRVGGQFAGSVVIRIDPKSRTIWTEDSLSHSF